MAKICFVSYEIHPTVSGGCGVLLYNAARLLLSQGHEVIFLLYLADQPFQRFNEVDRLRLPNPERCRAYQVERLAGDVEVGVDGFLSLYEFDSYLFHRAASALNRLEKPDVIEFVEYLGAAYCALNAKAAGLDYQDTHLAVRLHNSIELIDRYQPGDIHTLERYVMYNLERHALRLAETVLYPSRSYLEKEYRAHYEGWLGGEALSPPPLVDHPARSGAASAANVALFYGRLVGFKGADRFVDAAVLYLSNPDNPRRDFYLVGYDSNLPPGGKGSYQDYLLSKIPARMRQFFTFTGKLTWQELGELLPCVLFGVIPSYFESFCYAAHELYAAGVPLIVADIPAFEDAFTHEQNALLFDGSVSGLAGQMERLSRDAELRQKLTRPYAVTHNPLGDFYALAEHPSWMARSAAGQTPALLICILCEAAGQEAQTLDSIRAAGQAGVQVVLAYPAQAEDAGTVSAWFLGRQVVLRGEDGQPLLPTQIVTRGALLVLKAGDTFAPRFLCAGLECLRTRKQVSFVGSWKKFGQGRARRVETLAYDASPELLPMQSASVFSRALLRTPPGRLLIDLFDARAGELGEVDYLWRLDNEAGCGIVIGEALVSAPAPDAESALSSALWDYLLLRDDSPWRKGRLARYALSLRRREIVLRNNRKKVSISPWRIVGYWTRKGVYRLGDTPLNRWANRRLPGVKRLLRKTGKALRLYDPKTD